MATKSSLAIKARHGGRSANLLFFNLHLAPFAALFVLLMAAPHVTASRVLLQAGKCSPMWGQCGGKYWPGPTCCDLGSECKVQVTAGVPNLYYSQCLPSPPTPGCAPLYGQCAGINWTGPTCCTSGSSCQRMDDYYSQCR
eukprot:TRINITY_DN1016_c0_g1_i10.p1 TRINITY_DN1016_c0_g1~~TRINITY_DN1016_c0_g1_i10.p1  ORF type:complete len:140 (-),score=14.49 TRINITY_DN1016_c0_g1_i10:389-808(-)